MVSILPSCGHHHHPPGPQMAPAHRHRCTLVPSHTPAHMSVNTSFAHIRRTPLQGLPTSHQPAGVGYSNPARQTLRLFQTSAIPAAQSKINWLEVTRYQNVKSPFRDILKGGEMFQDTRHWHLSCQAPKQKTGDWGRLTLKQIIILAKLSHLTTSNLIKLLWPQWQEQGLDSRQQAPGEESGGQGGWLEPGARYGRVRGDRGSSREEGTSPGWVRTVGQARPAPRTAQLPPCHTPVAVHSPRIRGHRGSAGTGPPGRGFPETLPPCRDPTGNLSPAETPRRPRHWPQQEAEGSRETVSVIGDRGLETGRGLKHEAVRPPAAPASVLTPGLRLAWAALRPSGGGVSRGAWTQLPPESAASALLLTPAEPAQGSCSRQTLGCPARGQPCQPPRKGDQDARTCADVCSPPGVAGEPPGLLDPNPVWRDQVSLGPSCVSSLLVWVSSLSPRGDGGHRLVYSSGSWVPDCVWRAEGRCVLAARLSLVNLFSQFAREAQTGWGGAAGPRCLWGALRGVDPPEGPSHVAVLKERSHTPHVLLRVWSPRLSH